MPSSRTSILLVTWMYQHCISLVSIALSSFMLEGTCSPERDELLKLNYHLSGKYSYLAIFT
jgi:hypothetical protein